MATTLLVAILLLSSCLHLVSGHGRLIEPPSRASAWRYGFDTPHNYNDHELFCGGYTRQWVKNEGKCGVCGDAWDTRPPRAHEFGGTYGQGVIVRKYKPGSTVNIRVELTASHFGYFEFSICPNYKNTTQECLSQHILQLQKPQVGKDHGGSKFYPTDGNKVYEMKYKLPQMSCPHCVLQWRYIAGNNWGNCPNGTGAVGCGPQEEFRACADIQIGGKLAPEMTERPIYVPTRPTTEFAQPTEHSTFLPPTPQPSYSPISSLIITFMSFLVVSLVFLMLYFHYYQVGKRLKSWLKKEPKMPPQQPIVEEKRVAPLPPPRIKKTRKLDDGMHEIDLQIESLA